MKKIITLFIVLAFVLQISAQKDSTVIKALDKNIVTVVDGDDGVHVKVGSKNGVEVITDDWGDTTQIRVGRRTFNVIEDFGGTHIQYNKVERENYWRGHFNGHWAGMEMGFNMFREIDYSLYDGSNVGEFMDLNHGKSITVNFNFAEFAFKNDKNNFALVTGMGISFMDFTLDNPLTISKSSSSGLVQPIDLDPNGLKKSKLNVTYLTAPLILEIKTPLRFNGSKLYLAAGVIGGFNIGAHTKYKYKKIKEKERRSFNINPFKYELTGRIGLGDLCIFANWGMTPLFRDNKGPGGYPVTFGISFPNI